MQSPKLTSSIIYNIYKQLLPFGVAAQNSYCVCVVIQRYNAYESSEKKHIPNSDSMLVQQHGRWISIEKAVGSASPARE